MPRNIFIDTPTLTSLVFAQKKTTSEFISWEAEWQAAYADSEARVKAASNTLRKQNAKSKTGNSIASEFLAAIFPVVDEQDWILKTGKNAELFQFGRAWTNEDGETVADYFKSMLRASGFEDHRQRYVMRLVANKLSLTFPGFEISEVGYKLSKRKERARPNELMTLKGKSGRKHTNLHLADEQIIVEIDADNPLTALDYIRKNVIWN